MANEKLHYYKKLAAENQLYNARIELMKEKLANWNAPKEYDSIKEFGIEQLNISVIDNSYYEECIEKFKDEVISLNSLCDEGWKKEIHDRITNLRKEIEYHKSEIEKSEKHYREKIDYHNGLMKELDYLDNTICHFWVP